MSGRQTPRALDACDPIIVWAPDPDCDHEENPYCDHGLWVETRVTRDALARGSITLSLRPVDDDDDDETEGVVAESISLTCELETGTCTPDGTDGAIFLRHHPWLENAMRAELDLFRRRAARAAAQVDRETSARRALAQSDGSTMIRFHDLFPADWDLLPLHDDDDRYWAVDLYCSNPSCTCSSSIITFHRLDDTGKPPLVGEVVVDYSGREPRVEPSTALAAEIFETLWARVEYKLRARHAEAQDAVKRFARPRAIAATPTRAPPSALPGRPPRNAPCPCGSGKKYKRCCLDADLVVSRS